LCDPDQREFDPVTPRVTVKTLEEILRSIARNRAGVEEIAATLLQQNPKLWAASRGRIPILEEHLARLYSHREEDWGEKEYEQHWRDMSKLFLSVTTWGAQAGMATMPLFPPFFMESPVTREICLGGLQRQVLSIRENIEWLDNTMMLFRETYWRSKRKQYLAPILDAVIPVSGV